MKIGVEEVTQDPHPIVVEGAVIGVTAGAAVGATGMRIILTLANWLL